MSGRADYMVEIPREATLDLKEEPSELKGEDLVSNDVVSSSEELSVLDAASNGSNKCLEDVNSSGEQSDCSSEER